MVAQNQLFFHILIFMQTLPDTFTRIWVKPQTLHGFSSIFSLVI